MIEALPPITLVIAAGVIRRGGDVLLVHQFRRGDPHPTWALPGGRAERGENLMETLVREVREETGLTIKEIGSIAGVTHTVDSVNHHQYIAFLINVGAWEGTLDPNDPEGVILDAAFVSVSEAVARLQTIPWPDMRDPSIAAVLGDRHPGSLWLYREEGDVQKEGDISKQFAVRIPGTLHEGT
jgi:8-oxo-dGTP diphosphatase